MSPVFMREDGFVFKIHSNEEERRHIHIVKAENEAKVWLEPSVELAWNEGFNNKELKKVLNIATKYADEFKQLYSAHIGKRVDDK